MIVGGLGFTTSVAAFSTIENATQIVTVQDGDPVKKDKKKKAKSTEKCKKTCTMSKEECKKVCANASEECKKSCKK